MDKLGKKLVSLLRQAETLDCFNFWEDLPFRHKLRIRKRGTLPSKRETSVVLNGSRAITIDWNLMEAPKQFPPGIFAEGWDCTRGLGRRRDRAR